MVHVVVPRPAKDFQAAGSGTPVEPEMQIRNQSVLEPSGEEHTASFDQFVDQVQPCEYDLVYLPSNLTFSDHVAEQMSICVSAASRGRGQANLCHGQRHVGVVQSRFDR